MRSLNFEHSHRAVGAKVHNGDYAAFVEIAKSQGLAPGTLLKRLILDEIAKHEPELESL